MSWQPTFPKATHSVHEMALYVKDNWDALETVSSLEHVCISAASSGQHSPGLVGVMAEPSSTLAMTSISTPGTGALAWNIQRGMLYVNASGSSGDNWLPLASSEWSRVRAAAALTAFDNEPAAAYETWIHTSETYDTLEEYSTTTGLFTATTSGYYTVIQWTQLQLTQGTGALHILICKNGSEISRQRCVTTSTTLAETYTQKLIVQLNPTDTIGVTAYPEGTGTYAVSAIGRLCIHKMGAPGCL